MNKSKFLCTLVILIIVGCATLSDMNKLNTFNRTANAYRHAIRWSDFEKAHHFIKDAQTENSLQAIKKLSRFNVTSYEVKQTITPADTSQIRQIVEIKYYNTDDMLERTLRDHQLWEYDTTAKSWYLKGNLPDFK